MTSKSSLCAVLPDIHVPWENQDAVDWAIRLLRKERPKKLVLLGDVVDLNALSRFLKTPKQMTALPDELKAGQRMLHRLDREFKGVQVVYLLGNHEERLQKYLCKNAPALLEIANTSFRELLKVPASWELVPYGSFVIEQGVLLQHGTKWGHATCRQNLMFGVSSVQGHSHRSRIETHRTVEGRQLVACELGCLCDFDQSYSKLNDWTHACGMIHGGKVELITRDGHEKR